MNPLKKREIKQFEKEEKNQKLDLKEVEYLIEEPEEPPEDASELMKRIQQKLSRKYYGNFEEPTTVEGSDEELMIL
jgi:hypothetical protein